jgi:hypothetical protein
MQYLKVAEVQGFLVHVRVQTSVRSNLRQTTLNYRSGMGLASPLLTLAYLSSTYGVLQRLKIRRPQGRGVQVPPPGTQIRQILPTNRP